MRLEESSSRYRENRAGKASRQDPASCERPYNLTPLAAVPTGPGQLLGTLPLGSSLAQFVTATLVTTKFVTAKEARHLAMPCITFQRSLFASNPMPGTSGMRT
jgi:hypothetical protein